MPGQDNIPDITESVYIFYRYQGLKYELKEEKLEFSPVRGLSNDLLIKRPVLILKKGGFWL